MAATAATRKKVKMATIIQRFTFVVRLCTFTSGNPVLSLSIDIQLLTPRVCVSARPGRIGSVGPREVCQRCCQPENHAGGYRYRRERAAPWSRVTPHTSRRPPGVRSPLKMPEVHALSETSAEFPTNPNRASHDHHRDNEGSRRLGPEFSRTRKRTTNASRRQIKLHR